MEKGVGRSNDYPVREYIRYRYGWKRITLK